MTFLAAFPDYPAADLPAIPAGFVDVSDRNDVCPSFYNAALSLVIWCDYADHYKRDMGTESPRYSLNSTDECGAFESDIWAGDDWSELLAVLAAAQA
jgi:hypothetical protein